MTEPPVPDAENGLTRAHDLEHLSRLQGLLEQEEELDEELATYMEEDGPLGGPSIRHPLVYSVVHHPQLNALVNAQLKAKKEAAAEAKRRRNWGRYVWLFERPYRVDAFASICYRMGDLKYWQLLSEIWTDTENLHQNEELWVQLLTAPRRYRSHLMSVEERGELAEIIDKENQLIYRGFHVEGREKGLSWTTNPIVGKFFARRFAGKNDPRFLAAGRVDRKDIIAYLTGRSEYECIVLPHNVRDIEVIQLSAKEKE